MAKVGNKLAKALNQRRKAFVATMPSGQKCNMPGSLNRKKGYGAGK